MASTSPFIAITFTLLVLASQTKPLTTKPTYLLTKLVHFSSQDSPYFNASTPLTKVAEKEVEISVAHLNSFRGRQTPNEANDDGSIQGEIFTSPTVNPLFLVSLEIGTPPLEQKLALDTGSSLLWVKSSNTLDDVDYMINRLYDPAESSSFSNLSPLNCSKYCDDIRCEKYNKCNYHISYVNGETTFGQLGSESFFFTAPKTGIQRKVDGLVFGCSFESSGLDMINGILGLDLGQSSIISQLGATQFSYCLGNLSMAYQQWNVLVIGESEYFNRMLDIGGPTTPLIIDDRSQYYINLVAIMFDGEVLDIDAQRLKKSDLRRGGALVDTGTTFTVLQREAYVKLEEAIMNYVGNRLTRTILKTKNYINQRQLIFTCFKADIQSDFGDFPAVTFYFDGGARIDLEVENIFKQKTVTKVCINIVAAEDYRVPFSVIGVNLQQNLYTTFDLSKKQVRFDKIVCEYLWDD